MPLLFSMKTQNKGHNMQLIKFSGELFLNFKLNHFMSKVCMEIGEVDDTFESHWKGNHPMTMEYGMTKPAKVGVYLMHIY